MPDQPNELKMLSEFKGLLNRLEASKSQYHWQWALQTAGHYLGTYHARMAMIDIARRQQLQEWARWFYEHAQHPPTGKEVEPWDSEVPFTDWQS